MNRERKPTAVVILSVIVAIIAAVNAPVIQQWAYEFVNETITKRDLVAETKNYAYRNSPLGFIGFGALGFIGSQGILMMLRRIGEAITRRWDRMAMVDKVNLFLGVIMGIIVSLPLMDFFQTINPDGNRAIAATIRIALIVGLSSLSIYALRSMEEVLPWANAQGRPKQTNLKILDTNVIIDGRIYEVARSGFLEGRLYIPKFVLEELQHIADSADALRRQRGRRGLDVLQLLQAEFPLEVGTYDRHASDEREEVDSRLVRLARAVGGELVTNDVNLNRVAALQSVRVLNLNDLAMALKPTVLPRESLSLMVAREGNQPGQGVGYLDDGTMVVIENGRRYIGDVVDVVVSQVIQTERGKMIFGEVSGVDPDDRSFRKPKKQDA